MVEIQNDHDSTDEIGGKDLHHFARYEQPRPGPGPDKSVIDVVTDDGSVYRFSQLSPGDPFTYEPGQSSQDDRVSRTGRLPGVVEAVIKSETGESPGWHY